MPDFKVRPTVNGEDLVLASEIGGGGDMSKSVYDQDDDGKVDVAQEAENLVDNPVPGNDLNNATETGVYTWVWNDANVPVAWARGGKLWVMGKMQIAIPQYDDEQMGVFAKMYIRGQDWGSTAWSAWKKIWGEDNDGDGSGLDADLLDGVQLDRIVAGGNTTKTNSLTDGTLNNALPSGFYDGIRTTGSPNPSNYWHYLNLRHYNTENNYQNQLAFDLFAADAYLRNVADGVAGTWKRLWHSGNMPASVADGGFSFVIDGGGAVIKAAQWAGFIEVPYNIHFTYYRMASPDLAGSISINVAVATSAVAAYNYVFAPAIVSGMYYGQDGSWDVPKGYWLGFYVNSCTTLQKVTVAFTGYKY